MMNDQLRVGLIGLGTMGRIHAQNLLQSVSDARLEAVADPHIASIEEQGIIRLPKQVRRFSQYQDLLALDLDAVVVASATTTHEVVLWDVLHVKRPVLCEKPIGMTLDVSRALVQAFDSAGVPLQVGFMRRYDPLYRRAYELIQDNAIGRPYHFWSLSRDQFAPPIDVVRYSGGFWLDTGVHDYDLAHWLMADTIDSVYARGGVFVSQGYETVGDVDQMHVSFSTHSGKLGLVELGRNAIYGYDIRTEILGEKGAIQVLTGNRTSTVLMLKDQMIGDTFRHYAERFREAYQAELTDFIAAVRNGRPVGVSGNDALQAQAVAVAVQTSLESHQPTTVTTAIK